MIVPVQAETAMARELKILGEIRDKAMATAAEPINRQYEQSLEQLLRRATQANELETATKIKAILESLPQVVAKKLVGTWTIRASTGYSTDISFRADGTGTRTNNGKRRWRIEGSTLFLGLDRGCDKFDLPIKDGKMTGVNGIGNTLSITKK
jgi:hypothetical protein